MAEHPFLTIRYEGITAMSRDEFITVRVYAIWDTHVINCGMVVMFHHVFATLALLPPQGSLVRTEVVMTEGTVEEYLESVIGTAA